VLIAFTVDDHNKVLIGLLKFLSLFVRFVGTQLLPEIQLQTNEHLRFAVGTSGHFLYSSASSG